MFEQKQLLFIFATRSVVVTGRVAFCYHETD